VFGTTKKAVYQEERDYIRDLVEGIEVPTRAEAIWLTKNLIYNLTTVLATTNSLASTKSFTTRAYMIVAN
jgi:hypothetical protein